MGTFNDYNPQSRKAYKLTLKAENQTGFKKEKISGSSDAERYARQFYGEDLVIYESAFIILLNRNNSTIGWAKLSMGGVSSTVIDLKILVKYAIESLASGVILVHNHPSENPRPGTKDIKVTAELKKALSYFDINLLDHIILSEKSYYSFADEKVTSLNPDN